MTERMVGKGKQAPAAMRLYAAAAAAPAVAFSSGYIAVTTARPFCKRGIHFLPRENTQTRTESAQLIPKAFPFARLTCAGFELTKRFSLFLVLFFPLTLFGEKERILKSEL